jgi:hypothetical protein
MKKQIANLKVGEVVQVSVEDITSSQALIVNYRGELFRVLNQTRTPFKIGANLSLIVRSIHPLEFRLNDNSDSQCGRFHRQI